jgi:activator of HSP90 ATPase
MSEENFLAARVSRPTRRQVISGGAVAFGSFAVGLKAWGIAQQQTMKEAPAAKPTGNESRTSLHQEVEFKASPQRIYEILLDSKQFAAFTGMAAEIDPKVGGALTIFQGLVIARNIELVPEQRIVQAWRPQHWDPGVYSVVKFELTMQGSGTKLVLDHTGFPAGEFDSLNKGWPLRYWEPLKKYLS